jgi:hypothetical protein
MAAAKIEIKVGGFSFAGEGDERWLSSQLKKVLRQVPKHVLPLGITPRAAFGLKSERAMARWLLS